MNLSRFQFDFLGVSDGDKNVIVNEHNKYRAGVSPTAVQMGKMVSKDICSEL